MLFMKLSTKKRRFLLALLLLIGSDISLLGCMFLVSPVVHDTFELPFSEAASRELSLTAGNSVWVWFTDLLPGMSGRSAQQWIIWFYVTDPSNSTMLSDSGIVTRGLSLYPPTIVAHQDGSYTLHFSNSVGGNFTKTVNLSYKITQSVYGVPVEGILLFILFAATLLILIVLVTSFAERNKTN